MEKYSQFRDKGTGIAPFLPVPTTPSGVYLPLHIFLFLVRLPFLFSTIFAYFAIFCWLPVGSLVKKASLWCILGVPGIWWVDLQIDGVKKGSLTKRASLTRLPQPGSIIVSSSTSPLDALYLAAIFDPVFTKSYPCTRLVHRSTLFESVLQALWLPTLHPSEESSSREELCTIAEVVGENPGRIICVLPECTTTNGRGILPLSPALLSAPPGSKIFPTSLRYTLPDITTPVPGWYEAARFLWNLCSKPTHTIRVRVAEPTYNTSAAAAGEKINDGLGLNGAFGGLNEVGLLSEEEKLVLNRVGEALARLGRVKRVGVTVKDKIDFIRVWGRRRR